MKKHSAHLFLSLFHKHEKNRNEDQKHYNAEKQMMENFGPAQASPKKHHKEM